MKTVKEKFYELVWLNYQSSSELLDFVETSEFKETISSYQWLFIQQAALHSKIKFEKLKEVLEKELNIIELAKSRS